MIAAPFGEEFLDELVASVLVLARGEVVQPLVLPLPRRQIRLLHLRQRLLERSKRKVVHQQVVDVVKTLFRRARVAHSVSQSLEKFKLAHSPSSRRRRYSRRRTPRRGPRVE